MVNLIAVTTLLLTSSLLYIAASKNI